MFHDRLEKSAGGKRNIASIDVGSHTARMLVARGIDSIDLFKPLARKRAYISLADGFGDHETGEISSEALNRALSALSEFALTAKRYCVDEIRAVSTGVVRRANNRELFLNIIRDKTGIDVTVISGEKEARLTRKGVLRALNIKAEASVIFDLGGGTTEFIYGQKEGTEVRSIPLGCMLLTQSFFDSDPPGDDKIRALSMYIDDMLERTIPQKRDGKEIPVIIGSGGTITTIAAMVKRIDIKDITPDRLNGLILERDQVEDLFSRMKQLSISERLRMPGLDRGRAGVILAGTMAVIRILRFFNSMRITVSHSDILEGILISYLEGEEDE